MNIDKKLDEILKEVINAFSKEKGRRWLSAIINLNTASLRMTFQNNMGDGKCDVPSAVTKAG